jgi:hypothetical protein
MILVLSVYGVMFIVLGIILLICLPDKRYNEKAGMSKARYKRARAKGYVRCRVHYDMRVRRHAVNGERYW